MHNIYLKETLFPLENTPNEKKKPSSRIADNNPANPSHFFLCNFDVLTYFVQYKRWIFFSA